MIVEHDSQVTMQNYSIIVPHTTQVKGDCNSAISSGHVAIIGSSRGLLLPVVIQAHFKMNEELKTGKSNRAGECQSYISHRTIGCN